MKGNRKYTNNFLNILGVQNKYRINLTLQIKS